MARCESSHSTQTKKVKHDVRILTTRISNAKDEMASLREYMAEEETGLGQHVWSRRPIRVAQLNSANRESFHVLGHQVGGYPRAAVAIDRTVLDFDITDGKCVDAFLEDAGDPCPETATGHTKSITCLTYFGKRIYTGSLDCTIRAWEVDIDDRVWSKDVLRDLQVVDFGNESGTKLAEFRKQARREDRQQRKALETSISAPATNGGGTSIATGCVMLMLGHDAGIVTLHATGPQLISGAADNTAMLWDTATGRCLRRLRGHTASIRCIAYRLPFLVTGSDDNSVRVWEMSGPQATPWSSIRCAFEFYVDVGSPRVVSTSYHRLVVGCSTGDIEVFNLETGSRIYKVSDPHATAVTAVTFDATRLISGSSKGYLKVSDMAT